MNYNDTLKSVELVIATGEVPLLVGESGIGKTALAKQLAAEHGWSLIVIDGNLLKEGEIGGLPTIETYIGPDLQGTPKEYKTTIYAVHYKLREIDEEIAKGNTVLLFIDEINRCEHTVQQELMNLILNREINGYKLPDNIKLLAAMNPSGKYGTNFDYQVVDMDAAQENRFVWLYMKPDYQQWIDWAMDVELEPKVIEFISTFPEYLMKSNDNGISATPRSYERISKALRLYQEQKENIPRSVFLNVLKGNVGDMIAAELLSFIEADHKPLLSYEDVIGTLMTDAAKEQLRTESHTRLYLAARNILKTLETKLSQAVPDVDRDITSLIEFLKLYPVDLRVGIMKDIKNSFHKIYQFAIENEAFVELYFESYLPVSN